MPDHNTFKVAIPLAEGRLCNHFGHCEQFAVIQVRRVGLQKKSSKPRHPMNRASCPAGWAIWEKPHHRRGHGAAGPGVIYGERHQGDHRLSQPGTGGAGEDIWQVSWYPGRTFVTINDVTCPWPSEQADGLVSICLL